MPENIILIPEKRINAARSIILSVIPKLDKSNVYGITGFGSFWSKNIKRQPGDIDLAVHVNNDAVFLDQDKQSIVASLQFVFRIGVELHIITPYTVMIGHEAANYRKLLKGRTAIWGRMPSWI